MTSEEKPQPTLVASLSTAYEIDPDLEPVYALEEQTYQRIVNQLANLLIRTILSLRQSDRDEMARNIAQAAITVLVDYDPDVCEPLSRLMHSETMQDGEPQPENHQPVIEQDERVMAQAMIGIKAQLLEAERLEAQIEQQFLTALLRIRAYQQQPEGLPPYGAQLLRKAVLDLEQAVDDYYMAGPLDVYIQQLKLVISTLDASLTGQTPLSRSTALAEQLREQLFDKPGQ